MKNLAFAYNGYGEEIDDVLDTAEELDKEWMITNDVTADWAVLRLRQAQNKIERLRLIAEHEIEAINEKLKRAEEKYSRDEAFFTQALEKYFDRIEPVMSKAKAQCKHELLNGSLVRKFGKPTIKKADEEKLLAFLEERKEDDFIKTTKAPRWADVKANCKVTDDGRVVWMGTGEYIDGDGVTFEKAKDEFSITFN